MMKAATSGGPHVRSDENEHTKGFRFWEGGFWGSHLSPHPYHISALFVVDLDLFRERGLGDTYRSTYQQLTADPQP